MSDNANIKSLDSMRELENRVLKAVETIRILKEKNDSLVVEANRKDSRIKDLENLLRAFEDDQARMETRIKNALKQLDAVEDSVAPKAEGTEENEHTPSQENQMSGTFEG